MHHNPFTGEKPTKSSGTTTVAIVGARCASCDKTGVRLTKHKRDLLCTACVDWAKQNGEM